MVFLFGCYMNIEAIEALIVFHLNCPLFVTLCVRVSRVRRAGVCFHCQCLFLSLLSIETLRGPSNKIFDGVGQVSEVSKRWGWVFTAGVLNTIFNSLP